jgi:hypothetical protein
VIRRSLLLPIVVWLASLSAPAGAAAQNRGPDVSVSNVALGPTGAPSAVAASVTSTSLLADAKTRELLKSGFATEIRYRLESWREAGWFDDLESSTEWIVLVSYDPSTQLYRVVRRHGNQLEDFGGFATVELADAAVARPYVVALKARDRGRQYYYTVAADVETLSVSDLDELQRWLRGDLQPAVHGHNNFISALRNGLGTLVSRLLGGEKRHYEGRSPTYSAE